MSINKYQPHILVLPEDDANRQLANGFPLDPSLLTRNIQILEEAGGWNSVLERFSLDHVSEMQRWKSRLVILLIDFDHDEHRLEKVQAKIPHDLADRVFVLGALGEPEDLKGELGSYETIGLALAKDCRENTDDTWRHKLLQHNTDELDRLRRHVPSILFGQI
jgi:hypothetical protein